MHAACHTRVFVRSASPSARAGAVRLAHTDCLGEKRDEEKTTHALLSSLSMHAAQISSCFRFGLLITRSMGCAASRAPGGETRTRRFPPSMKPRRLLCEPRVRPQPTHTSEGRCAHTAGFLSLSSACVGFSDQARSARFRDSDRTLFCMHLH